jgi:hypothetical protein
MHRRRTLAIAAITAAGVAAFYSYRTTTHVHADEAAALPVVAWLEAADTLGAYSTSTEVRAVRIESGATRETSVAHIDHIAGAVARGDATTFLSTAYLAIDTAPGDFGATLYRIAQGQTTALGDGLVHASRPLVLPDGSAVFETGAAGDAPAESDEMRIDALAIEHVDAASEKREVLYRSTGYALHLAGSVGRDIVLYRVNPDGADIATLSLDSHQLRVVARIAPYARDFSIAGDNLVYSNRDASDASIWQVTELNLHRGQEVALLRTSGEAVAPYATLQGGIAYSGIHRAGLNWLRGDQKLTAPLGDGFDAVEESSSSGLLVRHATSADDSYYFAYASVGKTVTRAVSAGSISILRLQGSIGGGVR